MIVKEFYETREDGVNLYKTYSDLNNYIRKVNEEFLYVFAIDVEDAPYVYEETDIPIPPMPVPPVEETTENSDATVE